MLAAEIALLAFVHAGICLLDLLLDFLLHLFLLGFGHSRLELVATAVTAALLAVLSCSRALLGLCSRTLRPLARACSRFAVLVLLCRLVVCLDFSHVNLLDSRLVYSLPLFLFLLLAVKL